MQDTFGEPFLWSFYKTLLGTLLKPCSCMAPLVWIWLKKLPKHSRACNKFSHWMSSRLFRHGWEVETIHQPACVKNVAHLKKTGTLSVAMPFLMNIGKIPCLSKRLPTRNYLSENYRFQINDFRIIYLKVTVFVSQIIITRIIYSYRKCLSQWIIHKLPLPLPENDFWIK